MNAIVTKHKLDFEVAPWHTPDILVYRVGTCHGQYMKELFTVKGHTGLALLTVINEDPGNGHLEDVFQWFEFSAKRCKTELIILDVINEDFAVHLMEKRGFLLVDKETFYKNPLSE